MKNILTILLSIILLTGCKKEEVIAPSNNDPVVEIPTGPEYDLFLGHWTTEDPFNPLRVDIEVTPDSIIDTGVIARGYKIVDFNNHHVSATCTIPNTSQNLNIIFYMTLFNDSSLVIKTHTLNENWIQIIPTEIWQFEMIKL